MYPKNTNLNKSKPKTKNSIFILNLILITLIAWWLQTLFLINWDVSWDLLIANKMIDGGTYIKDFFDINPPLIFYIYMPIIFASHFFSISWEVALRIDVFAVAIFSTIMCYPLLKKIFVSDHEFLLNGFTGLMLFAFLILPIFNLGQREHFLVMFTLPYILLCAYRLLGYPIRPAYAAFIGLFAAMGFAIKPFFLLTPLLMQLYILASRHTKILLKIENVVLLVTIALYAIFVLLCYPQYLSTIVPMTHAFYYTGCGDAWFDVLFEPVVVYCYFISILCFSFTKNPAQQGLCLILLLAMWGYLLSYFMQQTNWVYHYLPAFSIAILLLFYLTYLLWCKCIKNCRYLSASLLTFFSIFLPTYYFYDNGSYGMQYKLSKSELISTIKQIVKDKSVYYLTATPAEFFPMLMYANVNYSSRFFHLLWVPGIANFPNQPLTPEQASIEKRFIEMLTDDIAVKKPDIIFVDVKDKKPFISSLNFDFLNYLFKDEKFKAAWQSYHYLTIIQKSWIQQFKSTNTDLYVFRSKQLAPLSQMTKASIILTTDQDPMTAYYVIHKKFLKLDNQYLIQKIYLSTNEMRWAKAQQGKINVDSQNRGIIDHILALCGDQSYKFKVYVRNA